MKANELRIGNYVLDNLGGILKIKGVNEDSDLSHVRGITITEEWLFNFGFEKVKEDIFSLLKDNKKVCTISKGNFGRFEYTQLTVHGIYIEYVHQLQNLYFALTGEELTYGGNNEK